MFTENEELDRLRWDKIKADMLVSRLKCLIANEEGWAISGKEVMSILHDYETTQEYGDESVS